MNYDAQIQAIITAIKADKSIVQPWKNYATKELGLAQACLRMGLATTNLQPPAEMQGKIEYPNSSMATTEYAFGETAKSALCICPPGGKHRDCPLHGWTS